jgi:pyruvate formate lyase activating enzyme
MQPAHHLRVGGLTPLTTIDYPGRLAAVVFCQGCPWRCDYCHNPLLLSPTTPAKIAWEEVDGFLERRRGLLEAVVFSGGEPTVQAALPAAARRVRELGFLAGLHTAGPSPRRLGRMLPHLDWVALDVKAPFADYPAITGVPASGERARESLERLLDWGGEFEIRTTVDTDRLSDEAVLGVAEELSRMGVESYALQKVRSPGADGRQTSSGGGRSWPSPALRDRFADLFPTFAVR